MRFGSLFSGIGGLDLGLERAGMECAWQVEWNPWCRKVLNKHWPDVLQYGDITELTGEELEPVDLICGGFPCQPVSLAGKQLAQEDDRWLWPHFARLIRVLRPRFALMENVPGLLSADRGGAFNEVLSDLADLGYNAEWEGISAKSVGAPHLRWRVFIVAHANGVLLRDEQKFNRGGPKTQSVHDGPSRNVADADQQGWQGWQILSERPDEWAIGQSRLGKWGSDHWEFESSVGRVADGIPHRVDRLRGLGNAVVPQVSEYVGRCIMEATRG